MIPFSSTTLTRDERARDESLYDRVSCVDEPIYSATHQGTDGLIVARDKQNEEVGRLQFTLYQPEIDCVHIAGVEVRPKLRGRGIGTRLYQQLAAYAQRHFRCIDRIEGDVTSRSVLRIRNRLFGDPLEIRLKGHTITLTGAMAYLPERSSYRGNVLDASRSVNVIHALIVPDDSVVSEEFSPSRREIC